MSKQYNKNSNIFITTRSQFKHQNKNVIIKKRGSYKTYTKYNVHAACNEIRNKTMSVKQASKYFNIPRTTLRNYIQLNNSSSISSITTTTDNTINEQKNNNELFVQIVSQIYYDGQINILIVIDTMNKYNSSISTSSITPLLLPPLSGPATIMTFEEEKAFCDWILTCSNLHIPTPKSICNQKASMILERRGSKFNTKTGLPSKEWWYGFYKRWPEVASRKPQPLSRGKALLTQEHVDAFFTDLHLLSNTVASGVSNHSMYIDVTNKF